MNYKIVVDSCCDLTKEQRQDNHFSIVPLNLIVDGFNIVDDDTFDQADFLKRVKESKECPRSACPSPQRFMDEYMDEDTDIYVITLSSELSGTYNSAKLGKDLYEENGGKNHVHVFNSLSASSGEVLPARRIQEYAESGMPFHQIVEKVEEFIGNMKTYFVIETLDTLRKNGRLTNLQAIIASALNIKPVMSADGGKIIKLDQTRGINKALLKMTDIIKQRTKNTEEKELIISHCNNYERAVLVKEKLQSIMKLKNILIVETAGVSSLYGNDGGIIIAV